MEYLCPRGKSNVERRPRRQDQSPKVQNERRERVNSMVNNAQTNYGGVAEGN